jgi:hypothetical protein
MPRQVRFTAAVYRDAPNGDELEIDVEVHASLVRYRPASRWEPAEGGVEEVVAEVDGREFPLTQEEEMGFAEQAEEGADDR